MYRDQDFDLQQELPWNELALTEDLELNTLLTAMAGDDKFLFDVARKALLSGLRNDAETVLYRQGILKDCMQNPAEVRDLYRLAVEVLESKRSRWLAIFSRYPGGILMESVRLLEMLVDGLRKLRDLATANAERFKSEGFSRLFTMLERELSDEYLATVRHHLNELKFPKGILLSAEIGDGLEGTGYTLRQPNGKGPNWLQRMLGQGQPAYTFSLDPRDESGARILAEMRDSGLNLVANAVAQSAEHVESFFTMLRTELAFYIGCLNLHDRLTSSGVPVCFPDPASAGERRHHFSELYDACLSLVLGEQKVVANTANADGKDLVIITGANQGGKSVFLRSVGLAQIMMQCGMFVTAESFRAELCTGLFTHYKREEDTAMQSGKLDEELARMSDIVDHLAPDSLLLCNESFAATNDREGSEIARQIVSALLENRVKVFFVTHLYEFAHGVSAKNAEEVLFLRAERKLDGMRTFKIIEGRPLETSFGEDLYREIFGKRIEDST